MKTLFIFPGSAYCLLFSKYLEQKQRVGRHVGPLVSMHA